jgi:hypothetical protein
MSLVLAPKRECNPILSYPILSNPRFFFAVSNTRAGQAYRFNLINLLKDDSLYNLGMLPLMHSERRAAQEVRGRNVWAGARTSSAAAHTGLPPEAA